MKLITLIICGTTPHFLLILVLIIVASSYHEMKFNIARYYGCTNSAYTKILFDSEEMGSARGLLTESNFDVNTVI